MTQEPTSFHKEEQEQQAVCSSVQQYAAVSTHQHGRALRPNIYPHSFAGPFYPTSTHTARQGPSTQHLPTQHGRALRPNISHTARQGPSTQHLPTQPTYHLLLGLYAGIISYVFAVYTYIYIYTQFSTRNPICRSKLFNSSAQRSKIEGLGFLS